jgi:hypothetical protein
MKLACAIIVLALLAPATGVAQDDEASGGQSRESMANDATAAQWSFQLGYEHRDWRDDTLEDGSTRRPGNKNMVQLRIVAPLPAERTGLPFTLLPRLTLRNEEAQNGSSGMGNTELFVLTIPVTWATGRLGIGPQVNFPTDNEQIGSKEWRYGLAAAALQRAARDKLLLGVLVQQIWGKTDPTRPDAVVAQPISIQPVFNWAIAGGFYLNIGETALSYDWKTKEWLVPVGLRLGKLWVLDYGTWNLYGEYRTTVVYEDWFGSALEGAFRINLSFTVPV